jgi:hypothetical protein
MAFRISGDLGDKKPFFRMAGAVSGTAHIEVIIDDKSIDREHASRLLRMMAEPWDDRGIEAVPSDRMILDIGPETVTRIAAVLAEGRELPGVAVLAVAVTDH